MTDYFSIQLKDDEIRSISSIGLAHLGDAVYELLVRSYLCAKGDHTVKNLHKDSVNLVKAQSQARFAEKLLPRLDEEEQAYYRRGKNAHTHSAPKAASPKEYAMATGVETLFGALYLFGRTQRLNQLFGQVMEELYGI